MQKRDILLVFLLIILIIPITSAEILISQPKSLYNVGDDFQVSITLNPNIDTSGFVTASLECSKGSPKEIYKSPLTLKAKEKNQVSISARLDLFIIADLEGNCNLISNFGDETGKSQLFQISKEVRVDFLINGASFNPGESATISGTAKKANSQPLEGFIEINVKDLGINIIEEVAKGEFKATINIPEDSPSGTHDLEVTAYNRNEKSEILNSGTFSRLLIVNEVIRDLDIALSAQSLIPGEEFGYTPLAYDQSGKETSQEVNIKILNPENKIYQELTANSQDSSNLKLETTSPSGTWTIKISASNITKERTFFLEVLEKLSYKIEGQNLIVKNIGNVPYNKEIEIDLGGESKKVKIKLSSGESKSYKLSAPEGEYTISVNDGEAKDIGKATLTGKAVSINDLGNPFSSQSGKLIVWIIIIIILGAIVLFLYRRMKKKNFVGKTPKFLDLGQKIKSDSESSFTLDSGQRQKSEIISLHLKNPSSLTKEANFFLESALLKAKQHKAKVYLSDNYRLIVLAPSITLSSDNASKAIEISKDIKEIIDNHNKKHPRNRIIYGIGINSGELVIEKKGDKFRFTSLGNIVSTAKRLSQASNSDILLSEQFHLKTAGRIRTDKVSPKSWRFHELKSKHKYEEFIKKFEEKKKHKSNQ